MKYKSKSSVYNDRLYLVAKWLNETARQRCLKPNYLIRALYSEMIHPGWHVVVFCWNRLFPVTIEPPSPLQITESPQTEFLSAGGKCGELPLFLNIYRFLGFFWWRGRDFFCCLVLRHTLQSSSKKMQENCLQWGKQ